MTDARRWHGPMRTATILAVQTDGRSERDVLKKRTVGTFIPFVLGLALMLAAACGGGGDGGAMPAGSPTPAPTPGPTSVPTPGPNASPIEKLSAAYLQGVDGKFVYRYKGVNWGEHPDGTWAVYRDGTNHREDWTSQAAGFPATTIAIETPDANYLCSSTEVLKQCYKTPSSDVQGLFIRFTPVREVMEAIVRGFEGLQVSDLPSETMAGIDAQCFRLDLPMHIGVGPPGKEETKLCLSQEGVLVYLKRTVTFNDPSSPQAELTAELLETGAVSPSDFQPIVPVQ